MVLVQHTPNAYSQPEEVSCQGYLQLSAAFREPMLMIEKLVVEMYANVLESIWRPPPSQVVPTALFIHEILKRSQTTFSTMQVSLFYLFRVKNAVAYRLSQRREGMACCARRMCVASLIVASKYLHDTHGTNKVWSQWTGLSLREINRAELVFLSLIDHQLFVLKASFDRWYTQLDEHVQKSLKRDQEVCYASTPNKRLRK
ncbi:cyclin-domain-containing protein [Sporodiniella umbellata]|nr:cyclin-domain-containing protein [Sporodiniella umbellata]